VGSHLDTSRKGRVLHLDRRLHRPRSPTVALKTASPATNLG
jgi:hypothetical protein